MNLPLTNDPEKYAAFVSRIPIGRWGELHEIGGLACTWQAPLPAMYRRRTSSIDGGWTAQ